MKTVTNMFRSGAIYTRAALVIGTLLAGLSVFSVETAIARDGAVMDPNLAYCTGATDGTTTWCGYTTLQQCKDSASGTGVTCHPNYWLNEKRERSHSH